MACGRRRDCHVLALATPASADTKKQRYDNGRPYYGPSGPNAVYQQGRTRIYVSKRSWLDGGTEVNPGDRKFSDYAFPPAVGYPTFARENLNRPIDRQPLSRRRTSAAIRRISRCTERQ